MHIADEAQYSATGTQFVIGFTFFSPAHTQKKQIKSLQRNFFPQFLQLL